MKSFPPETCLIIRYTPCPRHEKGHTEKRNTSKGRSIEAIKNLLTPSKWRSSWRPRSLLLPQIEKSPSLMGQSEVQGETQVGQNRFGSTANCPNSDTETPAQLLPSATRQDMEVCEKVDGWSWLKFQIQLPNPTPEFPT